MRRYLLIVVALVLTVVIWKLAERRGASHEGGKLPGIDAPAPDFSLQAVDGSTLSLANYRGKVVLLDFWATWCAPCQDEIPHFVEFQDKYGAQGFQVIGISMDDEAKPVREFYRKFKMNYPVAVGTAQVADAYGGVLGLPITLLIARDGRVAAKYLGVVDTAVMEREINSLLPAK